MDLQACVHLLQARLPGLMAVYAFGSRVREGGRHARPDSDLDLAVLVEGYADAVDLFNLSNLRAASTVMQHQILMQGERLWAKDVRAGLFESAMLTEKLHLDEARQGLIQGVMERGAVYAR